MNHQYPLGTADPSCGYGQPPIGFNYSNDMTASGNNPQFPPPPYPATDFNAMQLYPTPAGNYNIGPNSFGYGYNSNPNNFAPLSPDFATNSNPYSQPANPTPPHGYGAYNHPNDPSQTENRNYGEGVGGSSGKGNFMSKIGLGPRNEYGQPGGGNGIPGGKLGVVGGAAAIGVGTAVATNLLLPKKIKKNKLVKYGLPIAGAGIGGYALNNLNNKKK